MTTAVADLYEQAIRPLPASRRLQLATLILNDIAPETVADAPYDWEEEDEEAERTAWRALSLQSLARAYEDEEDTVEWEAEESEQATEARERSGA